MLEISAPVRWMPLLAVVGSLCWPLAASADPVVVEIENYVVSVGKRANYFDGKLLTTGDLSGDQDYKRGTDSLLGDPLQLLNEPNLTLDDLFGAAGRGDVRLIFECLYTNCVERREPQYVQDPHHDDMIFLDPDKGTWFGRLYLPYGMCKDSMTAFMVFPARSTVLSPWTSRPALHLWASHWWDCFRCAVETCGR